MPGRLRGELTEFVGPRAELALVRQALGRARLVTLTGPGGIGKTRLALQALATGGAIVTIRREIGITTG
jgi:hypothetical protein